MMNCPKCGKLIGHGTMGTALPLCQCQWKNDVAIGMPSEAQLRCIELESKLAASEEARKEVVRERDELRRKLAEQQAVVQQAIALMEPIKNYLPASHIQRWIACIQSPSDHFTKLLEEAKRQAVPEDVMKDAARYRWIRDAGATFYTDVNLPTEEKHHVCEFAMDAAIDAAMLSAAPQPHKD